MMQEELLRVPLSTATCEKKEGKNVSAEKGKFVCNKEHISYNIYVLHITWMRHISAEEGYSVGPGGTPGNGP